MATNFLFTYTQHLTRELPVKSGTKSGDPVQVGQYVGVALTDRGDGTRTLTQGNTTITRPSGGIGNAEGSATVARDGVAILPVTGATAATTAGTAVYITSAGALTTTEGTNALFGAVYGSPKNTAAACAVEIGA